MKFRGSFHNTTTFRCHLDWPGGGRACLVRWRGGDTPLSPQSLIVSLALSLLSLHLAISHIDYLNTLALPGGEWHYLYLHYIFDVRSKTRVYKRSIKVEIARGWSVVAVLDSQKCTKNIYFYNTQHKTETLSRLVNGVAMLCCSSFNRRALAWSSSLAPLIR